MPTPTTPRPSRGDVRCGHGRARLCLGLLIAVLCWAALASPGAAQDEPPPGGDLDQEIGEGQDVATGPAVLSDGHVDVGPLFVDGSWTLMAHDDGEVPTVWRSLEDAVLQVSDEALAAVPDDPTYDFLGVAPGTDVYVVPQVQRPGVVWLGWNTQDPEVMGRIDRGATLTLLGVQGPGDLVVYLQAGNLAEPDVLWRSTLPEAQPLWVEVNTHTHANWVFTEPGAYLVQVAASAELIDGEAVEHVATMRFAVGDATSPEEVREATFTQPVAPVDGAADGEASDAVSDDGEGAAGGGQDGAGGVLVVVAIVGVALLAAVAVVVARGRGAKRRAEHERVAGTGSEPTGGRP